MKTILQSFSVILWAFVTIGGLRMSHRMADLFDPQLPVWKDLPEPVRKTCPEIIVSMMSNVLQDEMSVAEKTDADLQTLEVTDGTAH